MKKQAWAQEFSVPRDGFYGHLFPAREDAYPGRAVLVLGGGGVPYQCTLDEAEAFAGMGITALAVGYFGVPGTPRTILRVPVEPVAAAADRLHAMGAQTVIAAGISKGAELALLSASLFPQINAVIAFSPSSRVNMGIGRGISWKNASSWTYEGKELPFAYVPASGPAAVRDSLLARELTFRPVYERACRAASAGSLIPVERIRGPVLLAASERDSLWPAAEACAEIMRRLDACAFPYPHRALVYPYASHLLLPFDTPYNRLFRIGRSHPAECRETTRALYREVSQWLNALPVD